LPNHEPRVEPPTEDSAACPECGEPWIGPFCHRCGEKRVDPHHDLALGHFAGHAVHEITHLDQAKIPRTLLALVRRPGLLTREYLIGRRKRYLSPWSLFLLVFGVYLFAYSGYRPAAVFDIHRLTRASSRNAGFLIDHQAAKLGMAREAFVERLDERWHHYLSLLELLNPLLFALLLAAVYAGSGRRFAEHFLFALHFFTFAALFALLRWPLSRMVLEQAAAVRAAVMLLTLSVTATYLYLAVRRVYPQERSRMAAKAAVLAAGFFVILGVVTALALFLAFGEILHRA
jgi:hypothetical protein